MVEPDPALVERTGGRVRELVQADERATDGPYDVTERSRVLVEHRLRSEQPLVPRNAAIQITDGQSDVSDRRKVRHGVLQKYLVDTNQRTGGKTSRRVPQAVRLRAGGRQLVPQRGPSVPPAADRAALGRRRTRSPSGPVSWIET